MGADLYIKSISDKRKAKYKPLFDAAVRKRDSLPQGSKGAEYAQKEVSRLFDAMYGGGGYFRDSYNGTSVLWRLGLSWWNDIGKMLDREGNLTPDKARELVRIIKSRKIVGMSADQLKENHCLVDDKENSPAAWIKSWQRAKKELIRFLERAIKLNESIYCSI